MAAIVTTCWNIINEKLVGAFQIGCQEIGFQLGYQHMACLIYNNIL